ncbi:hypothetical protein EPN95_04540 [Patescibacteria group bacterium]|nr:MAG: hypothetical protein EPN95_04540 [Patescibacteria group bacterium]
MSDVITHYGELPYDLTDLKEEVLAIPLSGWVFRGDPESYKTRTVSLGSPCFPSKSVSVLLDWVEKLYFQPGYTNRVLLSCVPAGEEILPHRDDFGEVVRNKSYHCHIPIITHPDAIMGYPDKGIELHMKAGHLYSIDETERHYVKNPSKMDRVHLLFAYFPHRGKS